eukprot:Lithocolla_globosa_v1_NODE_10731_length_572_cov_3.429400.p2 type:complete len:119 gc:universal NODE_10731_length_572_cov_3.429400:116-472(+)
MGDPVPPVHGPCSPHLRPHAKKGESDVGEMVGHAERLLLPDPPLPWGPEHPPRRSVPSLPGSCPRQGKRLPFALLPGKHGGEPRPLHQRLDVQPDPLRIIPDHDRLRCMHARSLCGTA